MKWDKVTSIFLRRDLLRNGAGAPSSVRLLVFFVLSVGLLHCSVRDQNQDSMPTTHSILAQRFHFAIQGGHNGHSNCDTAQIWPKIFYFPQFFLILFWFFWISIRLEFGIEPIKIKKIKKNFGFGFVFFRFFLFFFSGLSLRQRSWKNPIEIQLKSKKIQLKSNWNRKKIGKNRKKSKKSKKIKFQKKIQLKSNWNRKKSKNNQKNWKNNPKKSKKIQKNQKQIEKKFQKNTLLKRFPTSF